DHHRPSLSPQGYGRAIQRRILTGILASVGKREPLQPDLGTDDEKSQTENERRNQNRPSVLQTDQTRVQTDRFFLPSGYAAGRKKESNQRLKRSLGLA